MKLELTELDKISIFTILLREIAKSLKIMLSFVILMFDRFDLLKGIVKEFPLLVNKITFTVNVGFAKHSIAFIIASKASLKLPTQQSAGKEFGFKQFLSWWSHLLLHGFQLELHLS